MRSALVLGSLGFAKSRRRTFGEALGDDLRRRSTRGTLTLEAALRARIGRLAPDARALLEVGALAGRPDPSQVFARALGVPDVEDAARTLRADRLLRRSPPLSPFSSARRRMWRM